MEKDRGGAGAHLNAKCPGYPPTQSYPLLFPVRRYFCRRLPRQGIAIGRDPPTLATVQHMPLQSTVVGLAC